ncbi:MAG: FAD-dependent thymidylate synthase [bacterium]
MPRDRQIYILNPKDLTPETIAVTFAKTSRSSLSFREIAKDLTDEKSSEFHEKWVVGYGHASVAEHAVLHIAFENISRLAVETLQTCRLASFTEKSTRYQKWGSQDFYTPEEIRQSELSGVYTSTCITLFETYLHCLEVVENWLKEHAPLVENEEPGARQRRLRTDAIDACRFLLPSAALANVGMTVNARELEHAITKMLSSPISEVRLIGEEMKAVAMREVPTLLKYAAPSSYLEGLPGKIHSFDESDGEPQDWCVLRSYDPQAAVKLIAAALFRYGHTSYPAALEHAVNLDASARLELLQCLLGEITPHELPLREAEHINFSFEIIMDQGAYYEFKRHRMMSLSTQGFTPRLGYSVPALIEKAGMLEEYCSAMESARLAWQEIAPVLPDTASYVLPNGYNRRVYTSINLRSLIHLVRLRTRPTAHFSIRRVAHRMAECVREALPEIGQFLPVPQCETWQAIEKENFMQC